MASPEQSRQELFCYLEVEAEVYRLAKARDERDARQNSDFRQARAQAMARIDGILDTILDLGHSNDLEAA